MNKYLSFGIVGGTLLIASTALGVGNWQGIGTVERVEVYDQTQDGGSGQIARIYFPSPGINICGANGSPVAFSVGTTGRSVSQATFDEWLRMAQAAQLSGRPLLVSTTDALGVCHVNMVRLCSSPTC